jgi:hypothetical protein
MKRARYAHAVILLTVGAVALIWGGHMLLRALTADDIERIVLENSLGDGNGPELFALRFVGIGLLALIVGWFDWLWTTKRSG